MTHKMINTELLLNSVDWAIRIQLISINRQEKIITSEMQYNYCVFHRFPQEIKD